MSGIKDKSSSEDGSAIATSANTYGAPIWKMFYFIMEEEDKDMFYSMIEVLRKTLKVYNQSNLSEYFENKYFKEDFIKQYSKWYRREMYGVKWILDHNMHVESWHNFLKSVIMIRLKNVRIEKLLRTLVQAETVYCWKWARSVAGCPKKFDRSWIAMHGGVVPTAYESVCSNGKVCTTAEVEIPLPSLAEVKRTSYKQDICKRLQELQGLLRTRFLPVHRQKAVLKQLTATVNVYRYEATMCDTVVTTPVSFAKTDESSQRKIPRVIAQYQQFKRKRARKNFINTNVSPFRSNAANRHNLFQSFQMGCGVNTEVLTETKLKSLVVILSVKKTRWNITLGGITFTPSIAGIVIVTPHGLESLHVQVMKASVHAMNITKTYSRHTHV